MRRLLVVVVLLVAGCRHSSPPAHVEEDLGDALPTGKSVIELDRGNYFSPSGFRPRVGVHLDETWTSTHRGPDGFDVGHPDPHRDAPGVAVVFLRLAGNDPSAAVRAVSADARRAGAHVRRAEQRLAGLPATTLDIRGGHGQVVAGAERGIALDTAPGARLRVIVTAAAGAVLAVAVDVPRAAQWGRWWPQARALIARAAIARG